VDLFPKGLAINPIEQKKKPTLTTTSSYLLPTFISPTLLDQINQEWNLMGAMPKKRIGDRDCNVRNNIRLCEDMTIVGYLTNPKRSILNIPRHR